MKKIVIIGCGYGGLVAAWRLSMHGKAFEVTVIDRGKDFNFLPLLPDAIGRGISSSNLCFPIEQLSALYKFNFVNEEVKAVDIGKQFVTTLQKNFHYDYLIIASGSETNFYGNEEIRSRAYKLDDAQDAQRLVEALEGHSFESFQIAGGGYTGIEIATNLSVYLKRNQKQATITIVERAPSILGPLPSWMKEYVLENLARLDIKVQTDTVVDKVDARSMLIWAAGVKTAGFLQELECEKNPQGRVRVDEYLRLNENCFIIGDAANFAYNNINLRMAVQFAIAQASVAVSNILRKENKRPLKKFVPRDMGYLVPMANDRACGVALGRNLRGRAAIALHYFMCLYRAYGFKNKWGIMRALLSGGAG
jgi:NADH:ubiquinone reductase (H+-translocating)